MDKKMVPFLPKTFQRIGRLKIFLEEKKVLPKILARITDLLH